MRTKYILLILSKTVSLKFIRSFIAGNKKDSVIISAIINIFNIYILSRLRSAIRAWDSS